MKRLPSLTLTLAVVCLGIPFNAGAKPISLDNDVDVSWQQIGPEACELFGLCPGQADVFGAPRLVPDAQNAGSTLTFDIDIGNAFTRFNLFLIVGDENGEEVLSNGAPLLLFFNESLQLDRASFLTTFSNGIIHLSDFVNDELLPAGNLIFVVGGSFIGSSGAGPGADQTAVITVSGPGTVVPEPGTLVLLLSGLGAVIGGRFRRSSVEDRTPVS